MSKYQNINVSTYQRKSLRYAILSAALSLALTGCTVYHPQAVDIPLINHAGDTRLDASLSMSAWIIPDAFNLNATVSHGFNDWFSGQAHLNYGGDNFYGQVAPGAYFPLGTHSVLELYAGYGFGGVDRENGDDSENYNDGSPSRKTSDFSGRYHLPFLQANFGWHDLTKAHLDIGFGLKAGAFLPDFEYHAYDENGAEILSKRETYNTDNFLLEPQIMFRLGGESVRFGVKVGVAILSDWVNDDARGMIYDFVTASVGLTFTL